MFEQNIAVAGCLEDSINEGLLVSLIEVLTKEYSVYVELKDLLMDEKKLLKTLPSEAQINDNNILKENIILKSRILEEVRVNIIKKITCSLASDESKVDLEYLAQHATREKRKAIEQLRKELTTVAGEITLLNNENKYILDIYNHNVNMLLEVWSSLVDQSSIYLNNGKLNAVAKNGRLLSAEG